MNLCYLIKSKLNVVLLKSNNTFSLQTILKFNYSNADPSDTLTNFEKRFQQINDSIPKGFKAIANKIEYIKIEYLNGMLEFLKAYLHNVINLKHSKEFS